MERKDIYEEFYNKKLTAYVLCAAIAASTALEDEALACSSMAQEEKKIEIADTEVLSESENDVVNGDEMIYIDEDQIYSMSDSLILLSDSASSSNSNLTEKQKSFFDDCSSDYGFRYLGTCDSGNNLQKFYLDVREALEKTYYSTDDIKTTELNSQTYYCLEPVNFGQYGLSKDQMYLVYSLVRYDSPFI